MRDNSELTEPKMGRTLGRGKEFTYTGSVDTGVTIHYKKTRARVPASLFRAILKEFAGREIVGGFSMTAPTPGGLGEWVQKNSSLTPRHASHIAAILVQEGLVTSIVVKGAVHLHF